MRSKFYYGWHLFKHSHIFHILFLTGVFLFLGTIIFNSYTETLSAADQVKSNYPNTPIVDQPNQKVVSSNQSEDIYAGLLKEISKMATDETLKALSNKIGAIETLSSEQTVSEIREKIESNLAKDSTILDLIATIDRGDDDNKTAIDQLSVLVSKAGTEVALTTLTSKLETGLAKDSTLNDISSKLESGLAKDQTLNNIDSKLETGLAKDQSIQQMIADLSSRLDEINQKLAGTISASVSNLLDSVAITNFPVNYPSTSVERAQETIGNENFNRTEDFKAWATRKDYAKTAFSSEIVNPKTGPDIEMIKLAVPDNHTYYIYKISYATTSTKNTNFKLYHKPSGEIESYVHKVIVPAIDSKTFDFEKKIKTGDDFRIILEPVASASATSTATIFYYDLPWTE